MARREAFPNWKSGMEPFCEGMKMVNNACRILVLNLRDKKKLQGRT